MPIRPQYRDYILEQLGGMRGLRSNRMFSGIGLWHDGVMFGLMYDDTLYFKTAESNIAPYRERNSPRFQPFPDGRWTGEFGYRLVPADVIEDAETLAEWARAAAIAAMSLKKAKARPKKTAAKNPTRPGRARRR
jgi:DNA transformation protein